MFLTFAVMIKASHSTRDSITRQVHKHVLLSVMLCRKTSQAGYIADISVMYLYHRLQVVVVLTYNYLITWEVFRI